MIKILITSSFLLFTTLSYSNVALNYEQSKSFRGWFKKIILNQLRTGGDPRWKQKDCAGLIRFAVQESLRTHNDKWFQVSGHSKQNSPPEININKNQANKGKLWAQINDANKMNYANAITLIQENSRLITNNINQAKTGDLLFYDFGHTQHLMVWLGNSIAYHTGTTSQKDNGLRQVKYSKLLNWKDSRWRPVTNNPNFLGFFRFSFLPI